MIIKPLLSERILHPLIRMTEGIRESNAPLIVTDRVATHVRFVAPVNCQSTALAMSGGTANAATQAAIMIIFVFIVVFLIEICLRCRQLILLALSATLLHGSGTSFHFVFLHISLSQPYSIITTKKQRNMQIHVSQQSPRKARRRESRPLEAASLAVQIMAGRGKSDYRGKRRRMDCQSNGGSP